MNHKHFTLSPSKTLFYRTNDNLGMNKLEVTTKKNTKTILGVETTGQHTTTSRGEDYTRWYAEDKDGNVWYFGRTGTGINWEAGEDDAKATIVFKAEPEYRESYTQKDFDGATYDIAEVFGTKSAARIDYAGFTDCLKLKETSSSNAGDERDNYFCAKVGGLVLSITDDDSSKTQLVDVEGTDKSSVKELSNEEATLNALFKVPGELKGIEKDTRSGDEVWVVTITPANGDSETAVIVNAVTGKVLDVEN